MRLKKAFCLLLAGILTFACLTLEAGAVQAEPEANTLSIERASGRFSVDVGKQSTFTADSTFPLDIGDTVTIKATYTPRSLPGQRGSFSETFKVDQRGDYTLAIRNNSDSTVSISGTVTY